MNREEVVKSHIYSDHICDELISMQDLMMELVPSDYGEGCTSCSITNDCTAPVPGVGNVESGVCFIGRNPGKEEDKQGIPFVGRGGKLLNNFITWVGLDSRKVYITNIVKCYTADNRAPLPDEINICMQRWLQKEFKYLHPKLIVTLGDEACRLLTGFPLKERRFISSVYPPGPLEGVTVVSCVHPGAVLHNNRMMKQLRDDGNFVSRVAIQLGLVHPVVAAVASVLTESLLPLL